MITCRLFNTIIFIVHFLKAVRLSEHKTMSADNYTNLKKNEESFH